MTRPTAQLDRLRGALADEKEARESGEWVTFNALATTAHRDLPAVLDYVAELEAREARYRIALADAIRRPLGVVPDSVGDMGDLITQADIDQAEDRRPRT